MRGDCGASKMKKVTLFVLFFVGAATFASAWVGGRSSYTPEVRYISPKDESIVDLTDKKSLTFRWQPTPIPGGNRFAYKFELFKEFSYERIVKEMLPSKVFSFEVPAHLFEPGVTYTWQVKQRDEWTRLWSRNHRWSFKVK